MTLGKGALGSGDQGQDGFVGCQGRTQQVAGAGLHERETGARTPVSGTCEILKPVANPKESTSEPAAELLQETLSLTCSRGDVRAAIL